MQHVRHVRRPFLYLSAAVAILGVGLTAFAWVRMAPTPSAAFFLLLAAAIFSENFALALPGLSLSLVYPLTIAAAISFGPTEAAIIAGSTAINIHEVRSRLPRSVMLFNFGQLLITTCLASYTYLLLGGQPLLGPTGAGPLQASDFPYALLPLAATAVVGTFANVLLTVAGYSVKNGQPFGSVLASVGWLPPTQVSLGAVGFLIAQVLAISVAALPLFVVPLFVARQLYQRYTRLRSAYADTVRSLVGALEAKDPYTRGHSERVAIYSLRIGRVLGYDDRSLERLEYAALLHDLGKLALPTAVLVKESALTDSEFQAMRNHPTDGARLVERIPPLRELAPFVACHHEFVDGSGYPAGIGADRIPELSLVLSVADAYDAMTTDRAYRKALPVEAAIEELERCSGTQFSEAVVRCFVDDLEADGGPSVSPSAPGTATASGAGA